MFTKVLYEQNESDGLKLGPPKYETEMQRNLDLLYKKASIPNNLLQKRCIIENHIKFVTSLRNFHGLK
jgi:hypothetical protein